MLDNKSYFIYEQINSSIYNSQTSRQIINLYRI